LATLQQVEEGQQQQQGGTQAQAFALQLTGLFSSLLSIIPMNVVFKDFEGPASPDDAWEAQNLALADASGFPWLG
jgi:hypothetical protein